jgi:hypothetical protein
MFENLQSYYDYLEADNTLLNDHSLSMRIANLRDKIEDVNLKQQCSYEIFSTDYKFENGELKPQMSYTNGDTYPNFSLFSDDLAYLKERATNTQNPKHKAKYNHIIWCSKHKHNDFAKLAVDNYLLVLSKFQLLVDDHLSNHSFCSCFKNAFILGQKSSYKKEELISFLQSILGTKKVNGFKEYDLMKFILNESKKLDTEIFQFFFSYADAVINDNIYSDFVKEYLELLILLSLKANRTPNLYYDKLAEFYVVEGNKQDSFISHDYYIKAMSNYQKTGNKEKIEAVSVLIEKAKKKINFKATEFQYTNDLINQWHTNTNNMTTDLTENNEIESILNYIITSDKILPPALSLNENIRPATFDFVHVINSDINKNVSGKQLSGINQYDLHIKNFTIAHLSMVYLKAIKNDKLNFESLIEFLKKNSWYGLNFSSENPDETVVGFNWIELLSPSLRKFFEQITIDIKSDNYSNHEEYILAVDSLVIKFEGLIREFSRLIDAQTIEIKAGETLERISFEKILDNPKLIELLPPDDVAFFKYLFTAEGLNYRNNVAHCFFKTHNYSSGVMVLLITALLRLGNYLPTKE